MSRLRVVSMDGREVGEIEVPDESSSELEATRDQLSSALRSGVRLQEDLNATVARHAAVVEKLARSARAIDELVAAAESFASSACRTDLREHWSLKRAIEHAREVLR